MAIEETPRLLVAEAPDEDGTYRLFYVDDSGVTHKCGAVYQAEVEAVREALEATWRW